MINPAQIHLATNHLPVVGFLTGFLILGTGCVRQHLAVKRTGLMVLVFAALSALPAYFSGEPAEELVEDRPGVSEKLIHDHEEAAEVAVVFSALTGGLALASLVLGRMKKESLEKKASIATLGLALITTGILAMVAHRGGLIRHDELRGESIKTSESQENHEEKEHDED